MFLHLSIFVLLLILSLFFETRIREEKVALALSESGDYHFKSILVPWLIFLGFIAFLACVRTDVNDTHVYRSVFTHLEPSWDNVSEILRDDSKDKGFYILQNIFKMYISSDYHMWFLFFAVIETIILISVFRKETISFLDSMFFFFTSTLYFNYFSMMRQWFAVCLVFAGMTFIKKGKFIPYVLLCLFAAQFHNSAYIMIPVYFFVRGVAWKKKQVSILVVFSIALLFMQPILTSLESSGQGGTYDYVITAMNESSGASVLRPVIAIVPVAISFIYRKKINTKDITVNICVNMSILNFLLNFIAIFSSGLYLVRMSIYANMYNVILYPYLLNITLKDDKNERFIKYFFYVMYFVFYMYEMNNSNAFTYNSDIIGYFK